MNNPERVLELIRQALEDHLAAMAAPLPTVWQNRQAPSGLDTTGEAHQKAFLLPVKPKALGLRQKFVLHSGIFQVNLCYPVGIGAQDVDTRAGTIAEHYRGQTLDADGVRVRIVGYPDIAAPVTLSPYVVPVSISYESIN